MELKDAILCAVCVESRPLADPTLRSDIGLFAGQAASEQDILMATAPGLHTPLGVESDHGLLEQGLIEFFAITSGPFDGQVRWDITKQGAIRAMQAVRARIMAEQYKPEK